MPVDLKVLHRPFDPCGYEYDSKGFVYVSGRAVQQRLVEACGTDWGIVSEVWSEFPMPDSKGYNNLPGKKCTGFEVTLGIRIGNDGPFVGSGQGNWYEGSDRDTVKRGAITAAIRSAASYGGVGLELYPECAIQHWIDWLDLLKDESDFAFAKMLLARVKAWRDSPRASAEHKNVWAPGVRFVLDRITMGLTGEVWERTAWPEINFGGGAQQRQEQRPRDTDDRPREQAPRSGGGDRGPLKEVVVTDDGLNWNGPEALPEGKKGKCYYCDEWFTPGTMKFWAKNPDASSQYKSVSAHDFCVNDHREDGEAPPPPKRQAAPAGPSKWDDDQGEDPFGEE